MITGKNLAVLSFLSLQFKSQSHDNGSLTGYQKGNTLRLVET